MGHTLVQRGKKDWHCTVCDQSWQSPSKAYCPGKHVVSADEWGTLMTKTQLGRAGYKNDYKSLPKSTVCYRRSYDGSDPEYVNLYDPMLCERKQTLRKGRRRSGYLHDIVVPTLCIPFIERYREALDRTGEGSIPSHDYDREEDTMIDLANVIITAQWMSDKELAAVESITIQIAAFNCRKGQFFTAQRDRNIARRFATRVVAAYEAYLEACGIPFAPVVRCVEYEPPAPQRAQRRLPGLET